MSAGFSLVELLVACAVVAVLAGAAASLSLPVRQGLERASVGSDLLAGRRTALDLVLIELREAGSAPAVESPALRFARVVPPVAVLRRLDDSAAANPGEAVRVTRTPLSGPQATLGQAAAAGATLLAIDTTTRCTGGAPACGFAPGVPVVVYDAVTARLATVSAAGTGTVTLQAPLTVAFPAGSVVAQVAQTVYGTRELPDGSRRLVRLSGGPEQPVLDHVVEFEVRADSHDPQQMRAVTVRLRVEAPSAEFRGPAGVLFRRAGTATHPRQLLPDVELRAVVALRNRGR